jgi:hypothetical protein
MVRSHSTRVPASQKSVVPRTPQKFVVPRGPGIQGQTKSAPSRIVVPSGPATTKGLARLPRVKIQATRSAPGNLALVNRGLRSNPGFSKPAGIKHYAEHKAGKSGWMHHHRPFFFKRGGHRFHRRYYTFFVGGLWYWYWYDVIADSDPAAVVYPEYTLPECDPDDDECTEPSLIAPALLQGRATREAMDRCAAEFVSFDPQTGTYATGSGEPRVCPYLE